MRWAAWTPSLPPDWEIVPLIKVGRDLAPRGGRAALRGSGALAPGGAFHRGARAQQPGGAPLPVGRAALRADGGRRARLDLARAGPDGAGPRRASTSTLSPGSSCASAPRRRCGRASGARSTPTCTASFSACSRTGCGCCGPCPTPPSWFGCFDLVQVNEDEMRQLSPDPLRISAQALGAGVSLLAVTLGPRGAAYVAAPGFDGWSGAGRRSPGRQPCACPYRAHPRSAAWTTLDPTGCGDVFGAAALPGSWPAMRSRLALREANRLAARNARFRGASGLSRMPSARRAGDAVTRVVEVPAHFDDRSFDSFAAGFGEWPPEERLLLDARGTQWASPYGLDRAADRGAGRGRGRNGAPAADGADQRRSAALLEPDRFLPPRRRSVRDPRQGAQGRSHRAVRRAARRYSDPRLGGHARDGRTRSRRARHEF